MMSLAEIDFDRVTSTAFAVWFLARRSLGVFLSARYNRRFGIVASEESDSHYLITLAQRAQASVSSIPRSRGNLG